jgi:CBS domain containing-hemolysin-like protein
MKTLTYVNTRDINALVWPQVTQEVTLYSPALSVFTDFSEASPRVIEPTVRADVLAQIMKKEHVRMKLVVDSENHFLGVISQEDLSEEAFIRHVADGYLRSELLAIDMMRTKDKLEAVSYHSLQKSDIESLVNSQKNNPYQHLLVVDEDKQAICGLVSVNDIVRQLRLSVDVSTSTSFERLHQVLEGEYADSKRLRIA